jgi:membrane protein YdbS with pleckstrin-like domain
MSVPTTVTMADPLWRPSPKARQLWAINAALLWFPVFVVQAVALWRYRVHRWEISDTAVYTRSGWFTQERRIAPISRIQTVDTERGPIDRMLGLATVTVTTASSAGAVKISALDQATADRTVARLTEVAGTNAGDAT